MNTEIQVGDYLIRKMRPRPEYQGVVKFWVENGIGEGMETTQEKLEKAMAEFFTREF